MLFKIEAVRYLYKFVAGGDYANHNFHRIHSYKNRFTLVFPGSIPVFIRVIYTLELKLSRSVLIHVRKCYEFCLRVYSL